MSAKGIENLLIKKNSIQSQSEVLFMDKKSIFESILMAARINN